MAHDDWYAALDVDPAAGADDIKRAFRRLARRHHPDRDASPDAAERFLMVTRAYAVLSDPEKRAHFDWLLTQKRGAVAAPVAPKRPEPEPPERPPSSDAAPPSSHGPQPAPAAPPPASAAGRSSRTSPRQRRYAQRMAREAATLGDTARRNHATFLDGVASQFDDERTAERAAALRRRRHKRAWLVLLVLVAAATTALAATW